MLKYLFRKLTYSLLVIWGVVSLIFILFNVIPGDPARMVLGQRTDSASIAAVHKDLGLDKPIIVQYVKYINDLLPVSIFEANHSNSFFYYNKEVYKTSFKLLQIQNYCLVIKTPYLRRSYQNRDEVGAIIAGALPNSLILAFASIAFAFIVGILLGIVSALTKDSLWDRGLMIVSSLGMSLPSFFAAIIIAWLFAYILGDYTGLNLTGNLTEVDDLGNGINLQLKNLILPTLTMGIRPLSVVVQLTRNSLLDVLSQDYIRTARANGLNEWRIITRHALKNALNPVITSISGWFASMMAGVVFVEYIFGWKGLGYTIVSALNNFDIPLVMGSVIVISVIFVIVNILVDIIYSILDPRVRLGS
jgi:peptide/nickel transport system permease protein